MQSTATNAATPNYSCPNGGTLSGTNCIGAAGDAPASTTKYIYLAGKAIAEDDSAEGVVYTHADELGSPVARSNASATVLSRTRFEPYGNVASGFEPTRPNSIGFTGHVNDANTGLTYIQQRYYDPIAGRFMSVDPVVADAKTGKIFGRYTYVDNNPYKKIDPDGRCPLAEDGIACTAVYAPGQHVSSPELRAGLDAIAAEADRMLIVYGGDRDPKHNAEVGGAKNSEHLQGIAADVIFEFTSKEETAEILFYSFARVEAGIRLVYHLPGNGKLPEHSHLDMKKGEDIQQNKGGGYSGLTKFKEKKKQKKMAIVFQISHSKGCLKLLADWIRKPWIRHLDRSDIFSKCFGDV